MEWTRSDTLALAKGGCTRCNGAGLILGRRSALTPCHCVLRSIFKICHERFVKCVTQERQLSRVTLEPHSGPRRPGCWGRKDEEYIADFCLAAKRALTKEEHRLFRFHYLLGADWQLCSRRLGMDRNGFFQSLHRIEEKLGRYVRELEPYPLFPLDEYYYGPARENIAPKFVPTPARALPWNLRFPMPLAA